MERRRCPRRARVGEDNGSCKLTDADIARMRVLHALGHVCRTIADRYNVSLHYVRDIMRGARRPERVFFFRAPTLSQPFFWDGR